MLGEAPSGVQTDTQSDNLEIEHNIEYTRDIQGMHVVYIQPLAKDQKARNDARRQVWSYTLQHVSAT